MNASDTLTTAQVLEVVFQAAAAAGAVVAALGAVIAFFLKRYWDTRDRNVDAARTELMAREDRRAKERDILYQSLRWFEGGTQNRSIGIAVVNASWDSYPEFHSLWVEVFANQAMYLLAASKGKDKEHERDNLRRLLQLLIHRRSLLSSETRLVLSSTMKDKLDGKIAKGLVLSEALKAFVAEAHDTLALSASGT